MWVDRFIKAKIIPTKLKIIAISGRNPLIIEIYNFTIRTIVSNQIHSFAFIRIKFARKFKNISYGSTPKTL